MGFCSRVRLAAAGTAVLVGVVAGSGVAHRASAAISYCHSDPIVTLSNGSQVDLTATISDTASDVKSVVYTLHAPAGSSVVRLVTTGGAFSGKETLNFYADNAAGTYETDTVVSTRTSPVAVTAQTRVVGGVQLSGSASGYDKQNLPVHPTG